MQISIDTSKDSHDEIRKAIALLQSIVSGGHSMTNSQNIFENPVPGESAATPAQSSGPASLFGMFDGPIQAASSSLPVQAPAPDPEPEERAELELY
jgi:hypothetical protein